ncbi:MAG TPA: YciI family protein [Streptosporangiaceae bacterium]|nr:YciI family protein [Streptosporangiaceae bacterium]
MKYIVIIYGNKELWESFPADLAARAVGEQDAVNRRYAESGELLGAYGLGDELTAKTVRVREGVPAVTDGPYIEAKEFVSSFCLLDVENEARALQIAAEMPFAAHNAVEVWPILHEAGTEM